MYVYLLIFIASLSNHKMFLSFFLFFVLINQMTESSKLNFIICLLLIIYLYSWNNTNIENLKIISYILRLPNYLQIVSNLLQKATGNLISPILA